MTCNTSIFLIFQPYFVEDESRSFQSCTSVTEFHEDPIVTIRAKDGKTFTTYILCQNFPFMLNETFLLSSYIR